MVPANVRFAANMTEKVRVNVRPPARALAPAIRAFPVTAKNVRYHRCRCHLPWVTGRVTARSPGPARFLHDDFLSCLGSFRLGWIGSFRGGVRVRAELMLRWQLPFCRHAGLQVRGQLK